MMKTHRLPEFEFRGVSAAIFGLLALLASQASAQDNKAGILNLHPDGEGSELVGSLGKELERAGYAVTEIGVDELCDADKKTQQLTVEYR